MSGSPRNNPYPVLLGHTYEMCIVQNLNLSDLGISHGVVTRGYSPHRKLEMKLVMDACSISEVTVQICGACRSSWWQLGSIQNMLLWKMLLNSLMGSPSYRYMTHGKYFYNSVHPCNYLQTSNRLSSFECAFEVLEKYAFS